METRLLNVERAELAKRLTRALSEDRVEREFLRRKEIVKSYGDDTFERGSVVTFFKEYPGLNDVLQYVALKAKNDLWYLTGKTTCGLTWEQFVLFLITGDDAVTPERLLVLTTQS